MDREIKKIDLHMHSTISDGTDTLPEILDSVRKKNIDLFSVTDHDAILAGKEMPKHLKPSDPLFIRGVEFSCKDEDGKYHILGYGYNPEGESINNMVNKGHSFRIQKVQGRIDFLKEKFGFSFSEEDLNTLFAMKNPGKPHIGNLMVKYGYAETKEDAIKNYINKKRFDGFYVNPKEAISAILESDGIPILAHPAYGSGSELILGQEMEERLLKLIKMGIKGLEAYYSGFTLKIQNSMLELADKYNLYVTAGSDYHGKNKLVILGDNNLDNIEDGPNGMKRFLEDVKYVSS